MKLNWKLFAPLVVAILVWLIGAPEGLSANSWIYVSIFAGLVVGLILEPMPPAFIGIIAVTVSMLLGWSSTYYRQSNWCSKGYYGCPSYQLGT